MRILFCDMIANVMIEKFRKLNISHTSFVSKKFFFKHILKLFFFCIISTTFRMN